MTAMAEIYPLQILLATVAGWMNRRQGEILEDLIEENGVLKQQLKGKCLRLTDDQRSSAHKTKRVQVSWIATLTSTCTSLRPIPLG